ncbi:hypothetical protein FXO38_36176 [Capsicum annuum]|nr:hypothetical protein FXO38_36176 [Capsicum annuum]
MLNIVVQTSNEEMILIIQNADVLAVLASDVMRRAMETYNGHFWMASDMQPPLNYQLPAIPFFHIPTWETPTVGPAHQATLTNFPAFLPVMLNFEDIDPLYWQVQGITQGMDPLFHTMGTMGSLETTVAHLPNNIASSS